MTRWTFFQWTASMSTIRSLITGMLPIGSTVIEPSWARSAASPSACCRRAPSLPLIFTPHEPQMAAWHEQRIAERPVLGSLACRMASSTERSGGEIDVEVLPVGGLARTLGRSGGLQCVVGHQYFRSWGSHWVMVTSE